METPTIYVRYALRNQDPKKSHILGRVTMEYGQVPDRKEVYRVKSAPGIAQAISLGIIEKVEYTAPAPEKPVSEKKTAGTDKSTGTTTPPAE